jgi:hypothetical protein
MLTLPFAWFRMNFIGVFFSAKGVTRKRINIFTICTATVAQQLGFELHAGQLSKLITEVFILQ